MNGLERRRGALQRLLGAGQLVAARAARIGMRQHRRDRAAVLALEPLEQRQPLLDLVQPPRRGVHSLAVAAQLAGEVVGLDHELRRAVGQRVERGVDAAHRLERPRRARQRGGRTLAALGRHRLDAARGRQAEPLEVAQPRTLAGQLCVLGLARRRRFDLAQLPLEQVELAVARAGPLAQRLELAAQLPLARVDGGEPRAPPGLLGTAEAVEDLQLRGGQRQLAVLVLAIEGEQRAARVAQVRRRRAAPVQVSARAALGADAPGEHQLLRVGGDAVAQLGPQRVGQLEAPLDVGLRGARPHDPGARLPAQQQVERMGEHGLAGARLAREDVQAGAQPQLGPLDQQEVLDTQLFQHG